MEIKASLATAHKLACQASSQLNTQLTLKRFSRRETLDAIKKYKEAQKILQRLLGIIDKGD